jgi:hypothetical protein
MRKWNGPLPLADSSAWTVRLPCLHAPCVAAFRLAATDRSSPVPLPGPRAFAPRPLQRNFLSTKNHITRLLSPAHATRCRIWAMPRPYSMSDFISRMALRICRQACPVSSSTCAASRPTPRPSATAPVPSTPAHRRPRTCDWTCALCSGNSFSRRLSPLKRDSQPELYPSSGESRCFLFSTFN